MDGILESEAFLTNKSRPNQTAQVCIGSAFLSSYSQYNVMLATIERCSAVGKRNTINGDNQLVMERGIRSEQVIGYVTRIVKKDKERSTKSLSYRIYVFFWCFMPYRRGIMLWKRGICFLKRRLFSRGKD